jgi:hypothetical protein
VLTGSTCKRGRVSPPHSHRERARLCGGVVDLGHIGISTGRAAIFGKLLIGRRQRVHFPEEALLDVALPRIEPPLSILLLLLLQVLDLGRTQTGSTARGSVSASPYMDRGCCLWDGGVVDTEHIGICTATAEIFGGMHRRGKVDDLRQVDLM